MFHCVCQLPAVVDDTIGRSLGRTVGHFSGSLILMSWLLVAWLVAMQSAPADPALAARVVSLTYAYLDTDDQKQEDAITAEVRQIYRTRGVLTVAAVGDEASYDFVFLICSDAPLESRADILSKARAMKHQLPADAVAYCEARFRLDRIKAQFAASSPTHPAVRDELDRIFVSDQAVRQQKDFDLKKMEQADREHEPVLREIFVKHGAPTYRMVGPQAAGEFVTMMQHQPPGFRRLVLPKLKANVDAGQAEPADYASMVDRLRTDAGKKQVYGQNLVCSADKPVLHETAIEDEPRVNVRRARIGLFRRDLYVRFVIKHSPDVCAAPK